MKKEAPVVLTANSFFLVVKEYLDRYRNLASPDRNFKQETAGLIIALLRSIYGESAAIEYLDDVFHFDQNRPMSERSVRLLVELCRRLIKEDHWYRYWELSGLPTCKDHKHIKRNGAVAEGFSNEGGGYLGWYVCKKCGIGWWEEIPNVCFQ